MPAPLHIMIADNELSVVQMFESAIRRTGNVPVSCTSIVKVNEYLGSSSFLDMLYLDNHFPNEDFGVNQIPQLRKTRPGLQIVLTSAQSMSPEMVAAIVRYEVEFFEKPLTDDMRIEADIQQRIAARARSEALLRQRLDRIRQAADEGKEGVLRLLSLVRRRTEHVTIGQVRTTTERVIIPGFEQFLTVHVGQEIEIVEEATLHVGRELKASTESGLGLALGESDELFATALGLKLKARVHASAGMSEETVYAGRFRRGQVVRISAEEYDKGIRKREYHRGVLHQIWLVDVEIACDACGARDSVALRIFVPVGIVEVSVAYDMYGKVVEDGRSAYVVVS